MFRNSYLDTYKHAVLYNKQVEVLFVHLSQIYTTLGSVINDIEYQFGLLLSKTTSQNKNRNQLQRQSRSQLQRQNRNEVQRQSRNSFKSPYPVAKNIEVTIKNDINQLQSKLESINQLQKNSVSNLNFQYKPPVIKQVPRPKSNQQIQLSERRNSKQKYQPVIESTQDFDALFLNPKQQVMNQNSNTRGQSKPSNRAKQGSSVNNIGKLGTKRISQNEQNQFMDKLFGN